jgi:hypothetical protein
MTPPITNWMTPPLRKLLSMTWALGVRSSAERPFHERG